MAIDKIAQLAVDIVVNTNRARRQLGQFHTSLNTSAKNTRKLNSNLNNLASTVGAIFLVRRAIQLLEATILGSVAAYVKLEKQIVTVKKIARVPIKELTTEFLKLGKTISGVSFREISDTMSTAARLGIRGTAGLAEFTKTAVILSQVSGDISATAAAEGLGRLVKNFDLTTEEADNLASSIDALSDAFPTTSGQILTFSARLAGLAQASNITAQELNAFAAFMLSTGLSSTVARTSFVKFFNILTAKPIEAAKALRLTNDEMEKLVELSVLDPIKAFELFATKLSKMTRPEQVQVLEDLSAGSSRLQQAIFNAAGSIDKLNEALHVSEDAYEKSIQLIDKHADVANTADARIIDLTKNWNLFKASLLDTPALINTTTGALKILSEAINGLNEDVIDFSEVALADTPEKIVEQLQKVGKQKAKLRAEQLRLERRPLIDTGSNRAVKDFFRISKIEGDLLQLDKLRSLLQEKHLKLKEHEIGLIEKANITTEEKAKIEEENARKVANVKAVLKRQAAEEERKVIEKQGATFKPFLGDIGRALEISNRLSALPGISPEARFIANRQIEDIFKKQKEPNRFIGLTEAWKKAQTAVAKEDSLVKKQVVLAEMMNNILRDDSKASDARNNLLEEIKDNLRTGGPLQLQ